MDLISGVRCDSVTLSPSSPSAILGEEFTFMCTYMGSAPVLFELTKNTVTVGGVVSSTCSLVGAYNISLYNFSCPSIETLKWTIKSVSLQDHFTQWRCRSGALNLYESNVERLQVLGRFLVKIAHKK